MNKVIEDCLKNINFDDEETENTNIIEFDKNKYEKFYDLINNVIIFFVLNTYETIIRKNDYFDLEKIDSKLSEVNNIIDTLKLQLNIYWEEINKKENNNNDQLLIDLHDLLKIGIVKHNSCLFKYIKNMSIYIINKISNIKFENIKDHDEFKDKIGVISNSILQINKISCLEDEDEIECYDCQNDDSSDFF